MYLFEMGRGAELQEDYLTQGPNITNTPLAKCSHGPNYSQYKKTSERQEKQ